MSATTELRAAIATVPDFPRPGILFRDISPALRHHFPAMIDALQSLYTENEWARIDALAGIESRGFLLAAALAARLGKGLVPVRKSGKLPPPVLALQYSLEYGSAILEMHRGSGRLMIVDDVLATGGTMSAAIDLAMQAGYEVPGIMALIDLGIVPRYRHGALDLRALIRYD